MAYDKNFMCRCSEEEKKECDDILEEVKSRLDTDDSNLITSIIYSLHWDYNVCIDGISCDQWVGIDAYKFSFNKETKKFDSDYTIFMQCDKVEDGLAAIWKKVADKDKDGDKSESL